jgi:hypothetical protein
MVRFAILTSGTIVKMALRPNNGVAMTPLAGRVSILVRARISKTPERPKTAMADTCFQWWLCVIRSIGFTRLHLGLVHGPCPDLSG